MSPELKQALKDIEEFRAGFHARLDPDRGFLPAREEPNDYVIRVCEAMMVAAFHPDYGRADWVSELKA